MVRGGFRHVDATRTLTTAEEHGGFLGELGGRKEQGRNKQKGGTKKTPHDHAALRTTPPSKTHNLFTSHSHLFSGTLDVHVYRDAVRRLAAVPPRQVHAQVVAVPLLGLGYVVVPVPPTTHLVTIRLVRTHFVIEKTRR